MTKDKLKGLVALGSLLGIIGFLILFFSANLGVYRAESWLVKQGGVDTSIYQLVIAGFTNSFLAVGSILFGVGLATIVCAFYKILTSNESNVSTSSTTLEE